MAAAKQLEVMVVDDTSVSRMLMTESLQEIGITTLALAKDGAEALTQLKAKPAHLVISDQYMPNLDGLSATATSNYPKAHIWTVALRLNY